MERKKRGKEGEREREGVVKDRERDEGEYENREGKEKS